MKLELLIRIMLCLLCIKQHNMARGQQCTDPEMSMCDCSSLSFYCYGKGLTTVPKNIPTNSLSVDLQSNKLTKILDDSFAGLINVLNLNLNYNQITTISAHAFKDLKKVYNIYLRKNLLTTLPETVFSYNQALMRIQLYDNDIESLPGGILLNNTQIRLVLLKGNPTKCCLMQAFVNYLKDKQPEVVQLDCFDFSPVVYYSTFNASYCPVNGKWSEWENSTCSVTCGEGIITKTRTCNNPPPSNGGKNCIGLSSVKISCSSGICSSPVDGKWSDWQISKCSVTCGDGIKFKSRTCNNPAPAFGGKQCTGANFETELCTKPYCFDACESAGGVCINNKKACFGEILADKKCKSCQAKCCKKKCIHQK